MKSDIYIEKIDLVVGFDKQIKAACAVQAGRDEPRKLVAAFEADGEIVLIFELVN